MCTNLIMPVYLNEREIPITFRSFQPFFLLIFKINGRAIVKIKRLAY